MPIFWRKSGENEMEKNNRRRKQVKFLPANADYESGFDRNLKIGAFQFQRQFIGISFLPLRVIKCVNYILYSFHLFSPYLVLFFILEIRLLSTQWILPLNQLLKWFSCCHKKTKLLKILLILFAKVFFVSLQLANPTTCQPYILPTNVSQKSTTCQPYI